MSALVWLIPCALFLGGLGLAAFLWSLRTNQYEDLEGAAWRALQDLPGEGNKDQEGEPASAPEEQGKRGPPC